MPYAQALQYTIRHSLSHNNDRHVSAHFSWFHLRLVAQWERSRTWSNENTTRNPRTQAIVEQTGHRLRQGWRLSFHNGITTVGPFTEMAAIYGDTSIPFFGRSKWRARSLMMADIAQTRHYHGYSPQRSWAARLSLPLFALLSLLLTAITLPLYLALWLVLSILWTPIALFWILAAWMVRASLWIAATFRSPPAR